MALLSQYLPSRVSPFNTRRSALRLARCSKVPVIGSLSESRLDSPSRPSTVPLLAPFLLAAGVSPCAVFWLSLALRYWLTLLLHSPLFHIHITSKFSTSAYNRHYMPRLEVCFHSLLPVPIPANLQFVATPVDRSLVMRALGGAITSPCSNDPESRRPTPTIFGLSPHLLFICWMLLDSPIQITALSGRLLVLFCLYTWLVQLPLYYRIICIVNSFVSADRRATARTTTSLSHAAIRQKNSQINRPIHTRPSNSSSA